MQFLLIINCYCDGAEQINQKFGPQAMLYGGFSSIRRFSAVRDENEVTALGDTLLR